MRDRNDGSDRNAHGAPWNEDDEGNCECGGCRRNRYRDRYEERDEDERVERLIDQADYKRDEGKEWVGQE